MDKQTWINRIWDAEPWEQISKSHWDPPTQPPPLLIPNRGSDPKENPKFWGFEGVTEQEFHV